MAEPYVPTLEDYRDELERVLDLLFRAGITVDTDTGTVRWRKTVMRPQRFPHSPKPRKGRNS